MSAQDNYAAQADAILLALVEEEAANPIPNMGKVGRAFVALAMSEGRSAVPELDLHT